MSSTFKLFIKITKIRVDWPKCDCSKRNWSEIILIKLIFFQLVVAILGGSETGMEIWNPADGSVQLILDILPPEIAPYGLERSKLVPIKGLKQKLFNFLVWSN